MEEILWWKRYDGRQDVKEDKMEMLWWRSYDGRQDVNKEDMLVEKI